MNRLIRLAVILYPRRWRERYGAELTALIEDSGRSDAATLVDTIKGAIQMGIAQGSGRLILAFTLTGMALAIAAWAFIPNTYRSSGAATVSAETTSVQVNDAAGKVLSQEGIRKLMTRIGLDAADPEQAGNFRKRVMISRVEPTSLGRTGVQAFTVAFDSPDPKVSQAVAKEVLDGLLKNLQGASVIDVPNLPKGPISPAPKPILATGMLAGLLMGGLVALLRRRKRA